MHRMIRALVFMAALMVALTPRGPVAAQGGDLAAARVSHIGVVVPDVEAALREYVRVMGFPTPKINSYPVPTPDGGKAELTLVTLRMSNFIIEVMQPLNDVGPYYEHLRAHGMGIQHMGLAVPGTGAVDDVRAWLEQNGGRWVLGAKGANYAYVNFYPSLGTTLEVLRGSMGAGDPPPSPPAGDALPPLAALPVSHVGFAATDTAAVSGMFAKVLGITAPRVIDYKDAQYPPDARWNPAAYLRLATWSQGGTGMEIIESVGGPTPWSEYVQQHKGTAAQHIAFNVGNRMDETIRDLVAKGGKWTNGKPGGNYAYLDFMPTLGLVIELDGTSKSATAGK